MKPSERYEKETGQKATYQIEHDYYGVTGWDNKKEYVEWLEKEAEAKSKAEQERDEAINKAVEFAKSTMYEHSIEIGYDGETECAHCSSSMFNNDHNYGDITYTHFNHEDTCIIIKCIEFLDKHKDKV